MAKRIVIIGGGFAGLHLARNIKSAQYHITLVDRNNYVFFPPLLYQVATGFLEVSNISYPYRKMLRKNRNLEFKMGELVKVMPEDKKVVLSTGELTYDYLVFATGTQTNFFGMQQVEEKAIPMKTINDALEMRNYILGQLELATTLTDPDALRRALTIVVAGGGPTGVEISGMLAEMRTSILMKDYPELERLNINIQIYLVDGAPQLLSPMSRKSQRNAYEELERMGVKIILGAQVADYVDGRVLLRNGQSIDTDNLIWAAGVVAQQFDGIPAGCLGPGKRMITDACNKVEGLDSIYAIGDTCIQSSDPAWPKGHPQVAQVALQQGKTLAGNFMRVLNGKSPAPFLYRDRGSMAIIGRNKAVADISSILHMNGFVAWCMWVFVHLMSLVHFRNKITTLYNWMVFYVTRDQSLRMIIRPVPEPPAGKE